MKIRVYVDTEGQRDKVIAALGADNRECEFILVEHPLDADLKIKISNSAQNSSLSSDTIMISEDDLSSLPGRLNSSIRKGELFIPTPLGVESLSAAIVEELDVLRKIRDNNPMFLPHDTGLDAKYIDSEIEIAAHLVHPPALKKSPALHKKLTSRGVMSLQRSVDNWQPLAPATTDPDIIRMYPNIPKSASELRERLQSLSSEMADLDIQVSKSIMDKSQINLGIPFAGGHNRISQGLTPPSDRFDRLAKVIANVMLRGAAREYLEVSHDEFCQINTRVGVKSNNYQGAVLNTNSHSTRQTLWEIMRRNGNDIYHFMDVNVPTVSGFRRSDNPSGKCRGSYVLLAPNRVAKSRVLDGPDLAGKDIAHYENLKSLSPDYQTDQGWYGARGRIVGNVWSGQNDAIVTVPAYIAHFKDCHYKALFQQDEVTFSRFIAGSSGFEDFWREGYENFQWVRDAAAARGCASIDSLLERMVELGEHVGCGDVVSFDGNASWEVAEKFFKHLLSPEAMQMTEQLWNSDKIGCYTDDTGVLRYYYVTCREDSSFSEEKNALIRKTADLMSSLPSGIGPTAQAGRGLVPAALLDLLCDEFGDEIPNLEEIIGALPNDYDQEFSFLTAYMNSAGDDHNLGTLVIWLLTGVEPGKCLARLEERFKKYRTLMIEPEFPRKMNAGWQFHEDETGKLQSISLSDARMWANAIYPERPRSAIGLYHSVTKYVESGVDTPLEDRLVKIRDFIVQKVYQFKDLDELENLAHTEMAWLSDEENYATPQEKVAALLNIPVNDLEWKYSFNELVEMGLPEDLLDSYRRPIPEELTINPFRFLSAPHIIEISKALKAL